jgi:hypothetical protein
MKPSGDNTESELETDTSTQEDDEDDEGLIDSILHYL